MEQSIKNVEHHNPHDDSEQLKNRAQLGISKDIPVLNGTDLGAPGWMMLSPRQRRVAELVAAGLSDGEVSAVLGLSENTVGAYLTVIFKKFKVRSRTALSTRILAQAHLEANFSRKETTNTTHERVYCPNGGEPIEPTAMASERAHKSA